MFPVYPCISTYDCFAPPFAYGHFPPIPASWASALPLQQPVISPPAANAAALQAILATRKY